MQIILLINTSSMPHPSVPSLGTDDKNPCGPLLCSSVQAACSGTPTRLVYCNITRGGKIDNALEVAVQAWGICGLMERDTGLFLAFLPRAGLDSAIQGYDLKVDDRKIH